MAVSTHADAYEILEPIIRPFDRDGFRQDRAIDVENDNVTQSYWEAIQRRKPRVEQELKLEACLRHRRLALQDVLVTEPFRVRWFPD